MLIGVCGKKESGKNTVCNIIRAIDMYYNSSNSDLKSMSLEEFVTKSRNGIIFFGDSPECKWSVCAFADIIKEIISKITGCYLWNLYEHDFKESNSPIMQPNSNRYYTYRELLQLFGTEVGRTISENIWVDALLSKYSPMLHNWLICDVRFPNELTEIKERGGLIIHCNREGQPSDLHESERALDGFSSEFDLEVDFDPTLKTMIPTILDFMRTHNLM